MRTAHRAAGLLIVDGAILLEATVGGDRWAIPGGGLEDGERLVEACRREFQEELGLEVTCDSLAIVHESFWWDGEQPVREYGFYFRVTPTTPVSRDTQLASREAKLQFRWFSLAALPHLHFVPPDLPSILISLPAHIVFLQSGAPVRSTP